jgi:crotonobetainyl-CoA:carnitine CoA-transferase CaiB-like acyl-CoA transferase
MAVLGVGDDERFTTFQGRMSNREVLDHLMTTWCASRTRDEVVKILTDAEAAVGPVFTMADIANDPHYSARRLIPEVDGLPMQGLIAELSKTPGVLKWVGRSLNQDSETIRQKIWGDQS